MNGWEEPDPSTEAVVRDWLRQADAAENAHAVQRYARHAPELGWRCILAVLELPDGFARRTDLAHELAVLVACHGARFIDRIRAEAAASAPFRACLAEVRSEPPFTVPESLWAALSAARGKPFGEMAPHMARLYEEIPAMAEVLAFDPHPVAPEAVPDLDQAAIRAIAADWLSYQECSWAWDEVERLRDDPDALWPVLLGIVERGSDRALGLLGAGTLEDLVREHGAEVIDRIEARAAVDPRFRFCLSHVWRGDTPDEIWRRVIAARGENPQRG